MLNPKYNYCSHSSETSKNRPILANKNNKKRQKNSSALCSATASDSGGGGCEVVTQLGVSSQSLMKLQKRECSTTSCQRAKSPPYNLTSDDHFSFIKEMEGQKKWEKSKKLRKRKLEKWSRTFVQSASIHKETERTPSPQQSGFNVLSVSSGSMKTVQRIMGL